MPLYTIDAFVDHLHDYLEREKMPTPKDEIKENLIAQEGLKHWPKFVVDHPRREEDNLMDPYGKPEDFEYLGFTSFFHLSPTWPIAYFDSEDEALMFMLATDQS